MSGFFFGVRDFDAGGAGTPFDLVFGENTGDDFTGTTGTRMAEGSPTVNYSGDNVLGAYNFGGGDLGSFVLRFDLTGLPTAPAVDTATLSLTVDSQSNTPTVSLYRVLVNWDQGQSTWLLRLTLSAWGTPGAQGSGTDRSATLSASAATPTSGVMTFSSAQLAADCVDMKNNPAGNFGWVALPTIGGSTSALFVRQNGTDGERPSLRLEGSA